MLAIYHLYPDLLNLYGDRGNIIAFRRRCEWRGIPVQVREINLGERIDFSDADFLFFGGGSDREQDLMAEDLADRKDNLRKAFEDGLVTLAICGGYQLLGRYYRTLSGQVIPGLNLLDFYTLAGTTRLIGNVAVEIPLPGRMVRVSGFENHSGQTFLGEIKPFGRVLSGHGNNGSDATEGVRYKNVFCSYMHGPLLPKNPALTDYFIQLALERRGRDGFLAPLDNGFEEAANRVMLSRLKVL
ncbi:MAG: glutamine amidotransferase [Desulforudis sp.]|nr:glutamine amidotransferase [Clostridia bacterium]MDQ7791170.1 glutamine amidotransferase [Clostridia bacterium]RJX17917.1 MAG: glutamine amidotransferase [Desulforudis sp.]